jgi:hypothetical protein
VRFVLLWMVATLVAAAPASAATVGTEQRRSCTRLGCEETVAVLIWDVAAAEHNRLTIQATDGRVSVRDSGAPPVAQAPCAQEADAVVCPSVSSIVRIDAAGGDDVVTFSGIGTL